MPLLERLGLRRKHSTQATPGDASDGECDLDVFNPFDHYDMGVTEDGKPTSSFSAGSAYTVVDSPRLTMDDFLKRAPHAVADGRRPEASRAVTMAPAASSSRETRVKFRSEPELRRIAAAESLHRRYETEAVAKTDCQDNSKKTEDDEQFEHEPSSRAVVPSLRDEEACLSHLKISSEDESTDNVTHSSGYSGANRSQLDPGLRSSGSPPLRSRAMAMTTKGTTFQGFMANECDKEQGLSFSNSQNHASITAMVPSFEKISGYKFELSESCSPKRISSRQNDLLSIPSRASSTIIRHPDPPRTSDKMKSMTNNVPIPEFKKRIKVARMSATSSPVGVELRKENPKIRQERMVNVAIKRWSFWGSINRAGDDRHKTKQPAPAAYNETDEEDDSEYPDDEDRTAAFRSFEHADEKLRERILDDHLERVMEAARVEIKDKGAHGIVQVVDSALNRVYSRSGRIESAREEVRISKTVLEPASKIPLNESNEFKASEGRLKWLKDRLVKR